MNVFLGLDWGRGAARLREMDGMDYINF